MPKLSAGGDDGGGCQLVMIMRKDLHVRAKLILMVMPRNCALRSRDMDVVYGDMRTLTEHTKLLYVCVCSGWNKYNKICVLQTNVIHCVGTHVIYCVCFRQM